MKAQHIFYKCIFINLFIANDLANIIYMGSSYLDLQV